MRLNVKPPVSEEQALSVVKAAELIWNQGNSDNILKLFNEHCEWRDNDRHIHGKDEIAAYLLQKHNSEAFYQVRAELWNFSHFQISASFQSEWQHAKSQLWYRTSGHVFGRLDSVGLIREFCLSTTSKTINLRERSLALNVLGGGDE